MLLFQQSTSCPDILESSKHFETLVGAKELEKYNLKVLVLSLVRAALAEEAQVCG